MSNEREPPSRRQHETYEADHWTVVDIGGVDKVYATPSRGNRGQAQIRIDIDGSIAKSVMNDVGEPEDNVNTSIWLETPDAKNLVERLEAAISETER
jgi:hypothetical protein